MREPSNSIKALKPYQAKASLVLQSKKRLALTSSQGTGKTIAVLDATMYLDKILVLCPKSLIQNWKNEIQKWNCELNRFTILNYDILLTKKFNQIKEHYDALICDESPRCIKSWKAKRCKKLIYEVAPRCDRIYLLTATPAPNSAADYHPMLCLLLGDNRVGKFSTFTKYFCELKKRPFGVFYSGFKNRPELDAMLAECTYGDKLEDVADQMPEMTVIEYSVPTFTKEQDLDDPNAGMDMSVLYKQLGEQKVDHAIELAESISESIVFCCHHKSVFYKLCKAFKCKGVNGDTPINDRQKIVDEFNASKNARIVLNFKAGGIGINLQSAMYLIMVETPFTSEDYLQSITRIQRLSSEHKVNIVYRLIGTCSFDRALNRSLDNKIKGLSETMGDSKNIKKENELCY